MYPNLFHKVLRKGTEMYSEIQHRFLNERKIGKGKQLKDKVEKRVWLVHKVCVMRPVDRPALGHKVAYKLRCSSHSTGE